MMDPTTKKMVARLMEETSTGRLAWRVQDAPNSVTHGNDDVFPLYFESSYKGRNVCIYEARARSYIEDREYWNEFLVIGIVDNDGRVIWDYEGNDPLLHELFGDVRRSVSDVNEFLDYFR